MTSENNPNPWVHRQGLALLTDFYELTMLSGYLRHGIADREAVFEYFFRTLPPHTGYVLSAGLEQFLDYLENLIFTPEDLAYLESLKMFDRPSLDYLAALRPRVDVQAVPEGTPVFPHEPVLQVRGPLAHLQLIETFLLNALNYQSLIATKAARICQAAQGEPVLEFGLRRAQGPDGGLTGSRAAYLGGAMGTSNVLAGRLFNIPVRGTHAHSWVMNFATEREAFEAFAEAFPQSCVLLVDTYDTLKSGVPNAIEVFKARPNLQPAIRIDSGDLAKLSKAAHRMFAQAGLPHVKIVGSNDLDEDLIADLKRQGAKINTWAVGTHLITSKDHPALDGVYKMTAIRHEDRWVPRIKLSANPEKATDPGLKRVIRCFDADHHPLGDVLASEQEVLPEDSEMKTFHRQYLHQEHRFTNIAYMKELLIPVARQGKRLAPPVPLEKIRTHAQACLNSLPEEYTRLRNPEIYQIGLSPELARIKRGVLQETHGS